MRNLYMLIAMIASMPQLALGTTYGLGIATSRAPSLSLHISEDLGDAYHFTAHYDATYVQITGDYQRLFVPHWGFGSFYKCGFYTGAGVAGEAQAANTAQEDYHLRFPLGIQAVFPSVRIQAFFETAALLGTLPRTDLTAAVSTGVRAQF